MRMPVKEFLLKHSRLLRALMWIADHYDYITYHSGDFREMGENCIIHQKVMIAHPKRLIIKNNVQIHSNCVLHCQGGLYIGNNVGIANGTYIMTSDHIYKDHRGIPYGPSITAKPVRINDNVWIGANCKILPGIEIGEGSIIGMGSVVNKDVPYCAIVFGNPARVVGYRDKAEYERQKKEKIFVRHGYWDKVIVPKYTQRRPRLMEIIQDYITSGEMKLEE